MIVPDALNEILIAVETIEEIKNVMESQPNNPLHGVKLEQIINDLVVYYGWEYMGFTVKIKCFTDNPSIKSSLNFLRRTPWARTKVETMYLNMLKQNVNKKGSSN